MGARNAGPKSALRYRCSKHPHRQGASTAAKKRGRLARPPLHRTRRRNATELCFGSAGGTDIRGDLGMLHQHLQNKRLGRQGIHQAAASYVEWTRIRAEGRKGTTEESRAGHRHFRGEQVKKVAEDLCQAAASTFILVAWAAPSTPSAHAKRPGLTANLLMRPANVGGTSRRAAPNIFAAPFANVQAGDRYRPRYHDSCPLYYGGPASEGAVEAPGRGFGKSNTISGHRARSTEVPGQGRPSGPHPQAENGNAGHPGRPAGRRHRSPTPMIVDQRGQPEGQFIMGHGGNTVPAHDRNVERHRRKARLLGVGRYRIRTTFRGDLGDRRKRHYFLLAGSCTQFETSGLAVRPPTSCRWGRTGWFKKADLRIEGDDYEIILPAFKKTLGFRRIRCSKKHQVENNHPFFGRTLLREINRGRILDRLFRQVAGRG